MEKIFKLDFKYKKYVSALFIWVHLFKHFTLETETFFYLKVSDNFLFSSVTDFKKEKSLITRSYVLFFFFFFKKVFTSETVPYDFG